MERGKENLPVFFYAINHYHNFDHNAHYNKKQL